MRTERVYLSQKFKKEVINFIKAKYMLHGKKPPTSSEITEMLINNPSIMRIIKNDFNPK